MAKKKRRTSGEDAVIKRGLTALAARLRRKKTEDAKLRGLLSTVRGAIALEETGYRKGALHAARRRIEDELSASSPATLAERTRIQRDRDLAFWRSQPDSATSRREIARLDSKRAKPKPTKRKAKRAKAGKLTGAAKREFLARMAKGRRKARK